MSEFQSYSQAGQDRFVWEMLGPGFGTFLDVGANHPTERSNTYALERMGWTGTLVEADPNCVQLLRQQRNARVIEADATQLDWSGVMDAGWRINYLSLDVDEASLTTLRNVLESGLLFDVMTVEHDAYRFGPERRNEMLRMIWEHGYHVLCPDVCDQGMAFEAWAVNPRTMAIQHRFARPHPADWKVFFPE